MMERRVFASEEVYSYEGSLEEPIDLSDHESQLRFRQNVLYIPHMLPPVLILEYVPYYFNYQTYEPYLINRYEVAYVPFVRAVSYIQFVPYYSLQAPEIISSSIQYDDDILSNSDPSSYTESDTFETETTVGLLSGNNDSQHTESPSEVILESSINQLIRGRISEQAPLGYLEYGDEVNSSTSDFDKISILSGSSSTNFSANAEDSGKQANVSSCFDATEKSDFINPINENQASPHDSGRKKNDDSTYNDEEYIIALQYCEKKFSANAEDSGKQENVSSCFEATEKSDFINPINENQASPHDSGRKKNDDSTYNDEEFIIALQYPETNFSANAEDSGKQVNVSSCFDAAEKSDFINPINENKASAHDSGSKKNDDSTYNDEEYIIALQYPETNFSANAEDSGKQANVSSCFDATEKSDFINPINENLASPHDSGRKKNDDSTYNDEEYIIALQYPETKFSANAEDSGKQENVSSCFEATEKSDFINPINENQASPHDSGRKMNDDSTYNDEEFIIALQYPETNFSANAEDSGKQVNVSSCFDATEKSDFINPINENKASAHDSGSKKNDDSTYNDEEYIIALQYPETNFSANAEDSGKQANVSSCFDATEKSDFINPINENQASPHDSGRKKNDDSTYNDEEYIIALQYPETKFSANTEDSGKQENVSSCFDATEKSEFVNPIHEDQASPEDRRVKKEEDSSYNDDEDDGPAIALEDVLPSDEYWRIKREEYCIRRNNHQLYRSALEGDIRPRKPLPDVGTLATIFEDLPYPVNEPYDDGQDSNVEEFFDLPLLEVKKSESSSSALLPKKKKFRNTRKLFSRLFRCFKPKTVISVKPP